MYTFLKKYSKDDKIIDFFQNICLTSDDFGNIINYKLLNHKTTKWHPKKE